MRPFSWGTRSLKYRSSAICSTCFSSSHVLPFAASLFSFALNDLRKYSDKAKWRKSQQNRRNRTVTLGYIFPIKSKQNVKSGFSFAYETWLWRLTGTFSPLHYSCSFSLDNLTGPPSHWGVELSFLQELKFIYYKSLHFTCPITDHSDEWVCETNRRLTVFRTLQQILRSEELRWVASEMVIARWVVSSGFRDLLYPFPRFTKIY